MPYGYIFRPEPQTISQPTECSPLNLVLLGKDGLATSLMKEIRVCIQRHILHPHWYPYLLLQHTSYDEMVSFAL